MRIYIKNMVCNRCILVVKQELEKLRMEACSVTLGEVDLLKKPTTSQLNQFKTNLNTLGFELLDDSKKQLIEKRECKIYCVNGFATVFKGGIFCQR